MLEALLVICGRVQSPLHRAACLNPTRKVGPGPREDNSIPSCPEPRPRMQEPHWPGSLTLGLGKLGSDTGASDSATSAWGNSWKEVRKHSLYIVSSVKVGLGPCVAGEVD